MACRLRLVDGVSFSHAGWLGLVGGVSCSQARAHGLCVPCSHAAVQLVLCLLPQQGKLHDARLHAWMRGWMDAGLHGRMDARLHGWMNAWLHGCEAVRHPETRGHMQGMEVMEGMEGVEPQ